MVIVHKDILNVTRGILVQAVTPQGTVGDGLALQVWEKWPVVYRQYVLDIQQRHARMGTVLVVPVCDDSLWVASLVCQVHGGTAGMKTDYAALHSGLIAVEVFAGSYGLPVYAPWRMGCSLGSGDWNIVHRLLQDTLPDTIICKSGRS